MQQEVQPNATVNQQMQCLHVLNNGSFGPWTLNQQLHLIDKQILDRFKGHKDRETVKLRNITIILFRSAKDDMVYVCVHFL